MGTDGDPRMVVVGGPVGRALSIAVWKPRSAGASPISSMCCPARTFGASWRDKNPPEEGSYQDSHCKIVVVEVAGVEPASSGFSMGLLRAQPGERSRGPLRSRRPSGPPAD